VLFIVRHPNTAVGLGDGRYDHAEGAPGLSGPCSPGHEPRPYETGLFIEREYAAETTIGNGRTV
jgi:hypothetical protein